MRRVVKRGRVARKKRSERANPLGLAFCFFRFSNTHTPLFAIVLHLNENRLFVLSAGSCPKLWRPGRAHRVAGRSLLRPCERRPAAQARSPAARTHGACQISVIIFISSGFVPEWVFTRIRQHWSARRVGEALAQDMLSWCLQMSDSLTLLLQGLLD